MSPPRKRYHHQVPPHYQGRSPEHCALSSDSDIGKCPCVAQIKNWAQGTTPDVYVAAPYAKSPIPNAAWPIQDITYKIVDTRRVFVAHSGLSHHTAKKSQNRIAIDQCGNPFHMASGFIRPDWAAPDSDTPVTPTQEA